MTEYSYDFREGNFCVNDNLCVIDLTKLFSTDKNVDFEKIK